MREIVFNIDHIDDISTFNVKLDLTLEVFELSFVPFVHFLPDACSIVISYLVILGELVVFLFLNFLNVFLKVLVDFLLGFLLFKFIVVHNLFSQLGKILANFLSP